MVHRAGAQRLDDRLLQGGIRHGDDRRLGLGVPKDAKVRGGTVGVAEGILNDGQVPRYSRGGRHRRRGDAAEEDAVVSPPGLSDARVERRRRDDDDARMMIEWHGVPPARMAPTAAMSTTRGNDQTGRYPQREPRYNRADATSSDGRRGFGLGSRFVGTHAGHVSRRSPERASGIRVCRGAFGRGVTAGLAVALGSHSDLARSAGVSPQTHAKQRRGAQEKRPVRRRPQRRRRRPGRSAPGNATHET